MKILIDAYGGDNGPKAVIGGAIAAKEVRGDIEIILCGDESKLGALNTSGQFEIIHAPDVVDGHDDPTHVVRSKADSSMMRGLLALSEGKGDVFLSAGNTGALFSGATLIVKRLPGVKRGTLAPLLPARDKSVMLIDSGANVVCTSQMLLQFGIMGSIYMKTVKNIASPKVGLLNVGTESTKGTQLQLDAYNLLTESGLNFIGNIEGRDLPLGTADVVVTDGFTGNIALKVYEGMAALLMGEMKEVFLSNTKSKLGALLLKDAMGGFKRKFDYKEIGGTAFLGLRKPVFKAHGSSDERAFKNAILAAAQYADQNVTQEIARGIEAVKL